MADYNSQWTGKQIDEAIGAVREKETTWDNKQDAITGITGQIVAIGEDGKPVAQDAGDSTSSLVDLGVLATAAELNYSQGLTGNVQSQLDALIGALANAGGAKAELVTYVGTGTYGASNPTSLTFDFVPSVVFYLGRLYPDSWFQQAPQLPGYTAIKDNWIVIPSIMPEDYTVRWGFASATTDSILGKLYGKVSADKKTMSWYNEQNSEAQLNASRHTYYFLGISYKEE